MIVETGLIRFAIPDQSRDQSLYTYRRGEEAVSVAVMQSPALRRPVELVSERLSALAALAGDEAMLPNLCTQRPLSIDGLADAAVVSVDAPILDGLRQQYVVGRRMAGDVVCLRYTTKANVQWDPDVFETILRTLQVERLNHAPGRGWRSARSLTFYLTEAFQAPSTFFFSAPEWTVLVSHGVTTQTPWRQYFREGDKIEVVEPRFQQETVGRSHLRWSEFRTRVRRVRSPLVVDSALLRDGITDEHVLREALLTDASGRTLHVFGGSTLDSQTHLDQVWGLVLHSMEEQ